MFDSQRLHLFCLFAPYFRFICFSSSFDIPLVHLVVANESVHQRYAMHTHTHIQFWTFSIQFTIDHLLTIFHAMCLFISKSDVCMAVSAKVQTKAPQANPLRSKDLSSSTQANASCRSWASDYHAEPLHLKWVWIVQQSLSCSIIMPYGVQLVWGLPRLAPSIGSQRHSAHWCHYVAPMVAV